ncbi:MAG: FAD-dependent oxidoreductase [Betaproteobacteria bacterium]
MSAARVDVAVVGGGLVGAAIAFGMRALGVRLALLDEGDVAHRAARGNFGLIWVQGKGFGMAAYGGWTQASAREWPRLAALLHEETGIDVALRQAGGLHACLTARELDVRAERMARLLAQPGFEPYPIEVLDRAAVARRLPGVGPDVVGGTWSALDGDCNPLRLLHALHAGVARTGGQVLAGHRVTRIEPAAGRFVLHTSRGIVECARVVLAAGLANATLAPMVGLNAPVTPNKGQVIVLERVRPFLPYPLETLRQTDEGTVLIGDAQQERGFDETLDTAVLAAMAARAIRVFPLLRDVRVTRAWAALRVMSPDGFPVYAQSPACPGAFVVTCHSGVTLAAVHALALGAALADGELPAAARAFPADRFDVRAAA